MSKAVKVSKKTQKWYDGLIKGDPVVVRVHITDKPANDVYVPGTVTARRKTGECSVSISDGRGSVKWVFLPSTLSKAGGSQVLEPTKVHLIRVSEDRLKRDVVANLVKLSDRVVRDAFDRDALLYLNRAAKAYLKRAE